MNCKRYKESYNKADIDTIYLLNNHPPIQGDNHLTDKIMEAVLQSETNRIIVKHKNYLFERKLASSLICTGVFVLVINILAFNNNIILTDGFQRTIGNFNNILTNVLDKFQVLY